jgi:hypothetical protein
MAATGSYKKRGFEINSVEIWDPLSESYLPNLKKWRK